MNGFGQGPTATFSATGCPTWWALKRDVRKLIEEAGLFGMALYDGILWVWSGRFPARGHP